MKPRYQTDLTMETGNCIQYAVASLLEMDPDLVPIFNPVSYIEETRKFFNSLGFYVYGNIPLNSGQALIDKFVLQNARLLAPRHCLLGVQSFQDPRKGHCVVGRFVEDGSILVAHDPNPNNKNRADYRLLEVDIIIPGNDKIGEILF